MVTETDKSTVKAPISVFTWFIKVLLHVSMEYVWQSRICFPWIFLTYGWLFETVTHLPAVNQLKIKSNENCIRTQFCSEQVCLQKKNKCLWCFLWALNVTKNFSYGGTSHKDIFNFIILVVYRETPDQICLIMPFVEQLEL